MSRIRVLFKATRARLRDNCDLSTGDDQLVDLDKFFMAQAVQRGRGDIEQVLCINTGTAVVQFVVQASGVRTIADLLLEDSNSEKVCSLSLLLPATPA